MKTFFFVKTLDLIGGEIVASYKEKKITRIFRKKAVWVIVLIIALCLSVTTAVLTYYGQQVGNFVVGVSDEGFEGGLTLSTEEDFSYSSPRLVGGSISGVHPTTILDINVNRVLQTNGTYTAVSGNYMGYTFYLKNEGQVSVNIRLSMAIAKATHYLDRACWIWIFEGVEDTSGTVYKQQDLIEHTYIEDYNDYNIKDFISDEVVMNSTFTYFKPNEVKKFSVILWVEGEDPDCTDVGEYSIISGMIRFSMRFDVLSEDNMEISGGGL